LPKYPSLYQVNTRVWLNELSQELGKRVGLDDIPDALLDRLASQGFDWLYFLSVWQTGQKGRDVSRTNESWLDSFRANLPDLKQDDICGSGFAITGYVLSPNLGEPDSLVNLRERLAERGIKLMLDFVPNHTAIDHPWVSTHPDYYVSGTEESLSRSPQNYIKLENSDGERIFAYGRDPYFDGWPDTLQLNYGNDELRRTMVSELAKVADLCDGVRCDMAMLLLPEVFQQTWSVPAKPFWSEAISAVRASYPEFVFMAEVYWHLEWQLQQLGFDYTYDKELYDRLRLGDARVVREHLFADMEYQRRSARFLENHDEPRAAAVFPLAEHKAAAVIAFMCPGLRFFHQGQFEGYTKTLSVHLGRRASEEVNPEIASFYEQLLGNLTLPVVQDGSWSLLTCMPAWDGNWTWDCFIAFGWESESGDRLLVAVNYAAHQSQCYVRIPPQAITGKWTEFTDLLGQPVYRRDTADVVERGLYLDLPPWGYHAFRVQCD